MTLTLRILNPDLYVEREEDSVQLLLDFLLHDILAVVILELVGGGRIGDDPLYYDGLAVQLRAVCVLSHVTQTDLHHGRRLPRSNESLKLGLFKRFL